MEIQNLPKNTDLLPVNEQQVFNNLYASVETTIESEKSSEKTTVMVQAELDMKKEVLKYTIILFFLSNQFHQTLLKYTKMNDSLFWVSKALVLLILLYIIDKKNFTSFLSSQSQD